VLTPTVNKSSISKLTIAPLCMLPNAQAMVLSAILVALAVAGKSKTAGLITFYTATGTVYAIAYPISHTAVLGYFSKVVDQNKGSQGLMLSWFGSAGSVARISFPLLSGGTLPEIRCCYLPNVQDTTSSMCRCKLKITT
jgi:MFS family permease